MLNPNHRTVYFILYFIINFNSINCENIKVQEFDKDLKENLVTGNNTRINKLVSYKNLLPYLDSKLPIPNNLINQLRMYNINKNILGKLYNYNKLRRELNSKLIEKEISEFNYKKILNKEFYNIVKNINQEEKENFINLINYLKKFTDDNKRTMINLSNINELKKMLNGKNKYLPLIMDNNNNNLPQIIANNKLNKEINKILLNYKINSKDLFNKLMNPLIINEKNIIQLKKMYDNNELMMGNVHEVKSNRKEILKNRIQELTSFQKKPKIIPLNEDIGRINNDQNTIDENREKRNRFEGLKNDVHNTLMFREIEKEKNRILNTKADDLVGPKKETYSNRSHLIALYIFLSIPGIYNFLTNDIKRLPYIKKTNEELQQLSQIEAGRLYNYLVNKNLGNIETIAKTNPEYLKTYINQLRKSVAKENENQHFTDENGQVENVEKLNDRKMKEHQNIDRSLMEQKEIMKIQADDLHHILAYKSNQGNLRILKENSLTNNQNIRNAEKVEENIQEEKMIHGKDIYDKLIKSGQIDFGSKKMNLNEKPEKHFNIDGHDLMGHLNPNVRKTKGNIKHNENIHNIYNIKINGNNLYNQLRNSKQKPQQNAAKNNNYKINGQQLYNLLNYIVKDKTAKERKPKSQNKDSKKADDHKHMINGLKLQNNLKNKQSLVSKQNNADNLLQMKNNNADDKNLKHYQINSQDLKNLLHNYNSQFIYVPVKSENNQKKDINIDGFYRKVNKEFVNEKNKKIEENEKNKIIWNHKNVEVPNISILGMDKKNEIVANKNGDDENSKNSKENGKYSKGRQHLENNPKMDSNQTKLGYYSQLNNHNEITNLSKGENNLNHSKNQTLNRFQRSFTDFDMFSVERDITIQNVLDIINNQLKITNKNNISETIYNTLSLNERFPTKIPTLKITSTKYKTTNTGIITTVKSTTLKKNTKELFVHIKNKFCTFLVQLSNKTKTILKNKVEKINEKSLNVKIKKYSIPLIEDLKKCSNIDIFQYNKYIYKDIMLRGNNSKIKKIIQSVNNRHVIMENKREDVNRLNQNESEDALGNYILPNINFFYNRSKNGDELKDENESLDELNKNERNITKSDKIVTDDYSDKKSNMENDSNLEDCILPDIKTYQKQKSKSNDKNYEKSNKTSYIQFSDSDKIINAEVINNFFKKYPNDPDILLKKFNKNEIKAKLSNYNAIFDTLSKESKKKYYITLDLLGRMEHREMVKNNTWFKIEEEDDDRSPNSEELRVLYDEFSHQADNSKINLGNNSADDDR